MKHFRGKDGNLWLGSDAEDVVWRLTRVIYALGLCSRNVANETWILANASSRVGRWKNLYRPKVWDKDSNSLREEK